MLSVLSYLAETYIVVLILLSQIIIKLVLVIAISVGCDSYKMGGCKKCYGSTFEKHLVYLVLEVIERYPEEVTS